MIEAFKYQQEILAKYEKSNIEGQKRITELYLQCIYPMYTGTLNGPFTTSTTYFMCNGEAITIHTPSSLGWSLAGQIKY